jgi:hypothetical protein
MILALALLTVTQLSPQSTSARLLGPETTGVSGAPTAQREEIPGLKAAWMPMVVAGAITLTSVGGFFLVVAAASVGVLSAFVVGFIGLIALTAVHGVCALVSAAIGADNRNLRAAHEERKRVSSTEPVQGGLVLMNL